MSGYHQEISTNIENSRNSLRRIATNDDTEFSRESIVNLMEKFVKTVNFMDETILVPCRLMDLTVGDATDTIVPETAGSVPSKHHHHHSQHHSGNGKRKRVPIHETLSSAELFSLYNMLNGVKVDLLWGRNSEEQPEEQEQNDLDDDNKSVSNSSQQQQQQQIVPCTDSNANNNNNGNCSTKDVKGHARRPSTASVASSNSATTLSDSDSEISTENDSGIESECKHGTDKSHDLAKQYRKHLLGLYRCLEQMTDAANYLTARYQSDIGPV